MFYKACADNIVVLIFLVELRINDIFNFLIHAFYAINLARILSSCRNSNDYRVKFFLQPNSSTICLELFNVPTVAC